MNYLNDIIDADPYRPPRGAIAPPSSANCGEIKIFSARGRLGRVRYIGYWVGLGLSASLVAGLLGGFAAVLGDTASWRVDLLATGGFVVLAVLALAMSVLLTVRRLHDFDASGWWSTLALVPLANVVLYLVLLIMPGTQGSNRFGHRPPPNTAGVVVLALILPMSAVVGIAAAIAVPAYQQYLERAR